VTRERLLAVGSPLVAVAVLVLAWKLYVSWFDVSSFLLPPPEDVARATLELAGRRDTWEHAWVTTREIVGGFLLATAFGVVTGIAIAEVRPLERALTPLLVALQVIPKVTIVPLLLLWFGFGTSSKLVIAAVFAFFPITTGMTAGLKGVDLGHRDLAAVLQARRHQRLLLIDLPGALPTVLTGMEVAIVLATIGAVVGEYLAGSEGLGWLALRALNQVRIDELFGVIVLLSLLGFALFAAVTLLRRLLVPWHASVRRFAEV
jgi:NitT/TauT family transport system permease protein